MSRRTRVARVLDEAAETLKALRLLLVELREVLAEERREKRR